jgi:hypothetical protein
MSADDSVKKGDVKRALDNFMWEYAFVDSKTGLPRTAVALVTLYDPMQRRQVDSMQRAEVPPEAIEAIAQWRDHVRSRL